METLPISAQEGRARATGSIGAFASRGTWRAVLFGLLACGIWLISTAWIVGQFTPGTQHGYSVPVQFGLPALLLLAAFAAHKRWCFPDIRFVGDVRRSVVVQGLVAVTIIYLAVYGAALWMGQPREPRMMRLYDGLTPVQIAVMLASMPILVPVVEELVFRHFLLSVLPFKKNGWVAGVAVVVMAVLFALGHTSYEYTTTYVLLFALGVVLALARIRTDGLALPMGLHAYAIVFALVCDQAVKHLKG